MTVRSAMHRMSQIANVLLALSLLLALVSFTWSLELFVSGIGLHTGVALVTFFRRETNDPAAELA